MTEIKKPEKKIALENDKLSQWYKNGFNEAIDEYEAYLPQLQIEWHKKGWDQRELSLPSADEIYRIVEDSSTIDCNDLLTYRQRHSLAKAISGRIK